MRQFDIIVVGGGVNSLVTAALMGKAGKSVLLLEAKEKVGGLAATIEFSPGFTCNASSSDPSSLPHPSLGI